MKINYFVAATAVSYVLPVFAMLLMSGCATERTKYSDKNLRVAIDNESIDYQQYVSLEHSLVSSENFIVVDRSSGLKAVEREQERLHQDQPDRFADREKFAHWGKLYGVGAVIVANVQCADKPSFWNQQVYKQHCQQFLTMFDANTGEAIISVKDEPSGDRQETLPWTNAVEKLVEAYPRFFEDHPDHPRLVQYKDESERLAKEHQSELGRAPAAGSNK